jgi:hypothetical protein
MKRLHKKTPIGDFSNIAILCLRYFNPLNGKWLSRDPIAVNSTDQLGLVFGITFVRFDTLIGHGWIRDGGYTWTTINMANENKTAEVGKIEYSARVIGRCTGGL